MPVDKGEQMAVPLDLLRLLREPVLVEPALGAELARVGAPERDSRIHAADGHGDFLALGDGDVVGELARWEAQGSGERNDVILRGLLRLKESVWSADGGTRRARTRRTTRVVTLSGAWSRRISCTTASR